MHSFKEILVIRSVWFWSVHSLHDKTISLPTWASQLYLPSLISLPVAGCGQLQLGAVHWATSVALLQIFDNSGSRLSTGAPAFQGIKDYNFYFFTKLCIRNRVRELTLPRYCTHLFGVLGVRYEPVGGVAQLLYMGWQVPPAAPPSLGAPKRPRSLPRLQHQLSHLLLTGTCQEPLHRYKLLLVIINYYILLMTICSEKQGECS